MSATHRMELLSVVLILVISACAPPSQRGTAETAARAADAFMQALARGDANDAWAHLTPATRRVIYDDDAAAFARDVAETDWSSLSWEIGPVIDHDISWGVHLLIEESAIPVFLLEREIAGGWDDFGIVLLVQIPASDENYLVAGQGLDIDLR